MVSRQSGHKVRHNMKAGNETTYNTRVPAHAESILPKMYQSQILQLNLTRIEPAHAGLCLAPGLHR